MKDPGRAAGVIEYIEVTEQDVAIARDLLPLILERNLDELSPPTRALLLQIEKLVDEKRKATPARPPAPSLGAASSLRLRRPDEADEAHLLVSRQEIQKATGLSYWHVRTYMPQLVEYEYLAEARGRNGRTLYRLLREGEEG